jgi:hypothetical protein
MSNLLTLHDDAAGVVGWTLTTYSPVGSTMIPPHQLTGRNSFSLGGCGG